MLNAMSCARRRLLEEVPGGAPRGGAALVRIAAQNSQTSHLALWSDS